MYDTYRFKDKDPVIDIARTCVQIFASTNNVSFHKALILLSKSSKVSVSCMEGWFYGSTCQPRFATVVAVVHATGKQVTVAGKSIGYKPRFRVIRGKAA